MAGMSCEQPKKEKEAGACAFVLNGRLLIVAVVDDARTDTPLLPCGTIIITRGGTRHRSLARRHHSLTPTLFCAGRGSPRGALLYVSLA